MTENLLQKLEEKMMTLLTEVEDLRKETRRLHEENALLKTERENQRVSSHTHAEKLKGLIELLDTVHVDKAITNIAAIKPILVQGEGL